MPGEVPIVIEHRQILWKLAGEGQTTIATPQHRDAVGSHRDGVKPIATTPGTRGKGDEIDSFEHFDRSFITHCRTPAVELFGFCSSNLTPEDLTPDSSEIGRVRTITPGSAGDVRLATPVEFIQTSWGTHRNTLFRQSAAYAPSAAGRPWWREREASTHLCNKLSTKPRYRPNPALESTSP